MGKRHQGKASSCFVCCFAPAAVEVGDAGASHPGRGGKQPSQGDVLRKQQQQHADNNKAYDWQMYADFHGKQQQPAWQQMFKDSASIPDQVVPGKQAGLAALSAATLPERPGRLSDSCSAPLTNRSLAAAGCHSLSAVTSAGYQRPASAIRQQDTGDSPSEIHSELQQAKKLSSYATNSCQASVTASSSKSVPCSSVVDLDRCSLAAGFQQQQQKQQVGQQQQMPEQRQIQPVPAPEADNMSDRNAEATRRAAAVRAIANGSNTGSNSPPAANAGAVSVPGTVTAATGEGTEASSSCPVLANNSSNNGMSSRAQRPTTLAVPVMGGQQQLDEQPSMLLVTQPAEADGSASNSLSTSLKSSRSPFASPGYQKAIASNLLATQISDKAAAAARRAASAPSSTGSTSLSTSPANSVRLDCMPPAASTSTSWVPAAAAAAAAAVAAAAAAAATADAARSSAAAAVYLHQGSVRRSGSRSNLMSSAMMLGAVPEVFEVLDPENPLGDSSSRILKHSASAKSLASAGSSIGLKSSGPVNKFRMALSTGSMGRSASSASLATAPSRQRQCHPAYSMHSSRSVMRRETAHFSAGNVYGDKQSQATRRSRSAHASVLNQQLGTPFAKASGQTATAASVGLQSSSSKQQLPPLSPTQAAATVAPAATLEGSGVLTGSNTGPSGSSTSGSSSVPKVPTQTSLEASSSMSVSSERASLASASSSSLIATAVCRMQPTRTAAEHSSSGSGHGADKTAKKGPLGVFAAWKAGHNRSSGSSSESNSSCSVATVFAEAYLAALAAGDAKWASEAAVSSLIHEAAKMLGLDKQVYTGKAAIVRRLNAGMQQLMQMAEATLGGRVSSGSSSSSTTTTNAAPAGEQSSANVITHSATAAARAAGSSSSAQQPDADTASRFSAAGAGLAGQLPKPQLDVSCPDPATKPTFVVAVYTFKWGLRRFTMRDEFIVKHGQILRLRRSRG